MRAASRAAIVTAMMAGFAGAVDLSAHRRDEYLQAARIAVEPRRVDLELDLTPGITVADAVIAGIDRDRDGMLSPAEQSRYRDEVLADLQLSIDGHALRVESIESRFPEVGLMRRGEGSIWLHAAAVLPLLPNGRHRLAFTNLHRRAASAFLANALAPRSDRIAVIAQQRDGDQHAESIDFMLTGSAAPPSLWVLGSIAAAIAGAGWWLRPPRVGARRSA